MVNVKTSCPIFGDVELPPGHIRIEHGPEQSTWIIQCPECVDEHERPATPAVLQLLRKAGVIEHHYLDPGDDGFWDERRLLKWMLLLSIGIATVPQITIDRARATYTRSDAPAVPEHPFLDEPCRPVSPFDRGWRAWVRRGLRLDGAA